MLLQYLSYLSIHLSASIWGHTFEGIHVSASICDGKVYRSGGQTRYRLQKVHPKRKMSPESFKCPLVLSSHFLLLFRCKIILDVEVCSNFFWGFTFDNVSYCLAAQRSANTGPQPCSRCSTQAEQHIQKQAELLTVGP